MELEMRCFFKCTKKFQNAVILAKEESVGQIKKELKNVSNFIFVKTLNEFKENINPNSFLAISISITEFEPVANLIKQYPNCFFHKIIEPPDSWLLKNNVEINKERNIDKYSYLIYELINHIKKEVQLVC
jgi:hypothetical protein